MADYTDHFTIILLFLWDAINLHQILYYYDKVFMSQYPLDSKNIKHQIWALFYSPK